MLTVWMILPVMASLVSFAALLLVPPAVTAVPTRFELIASIAAAYSADIPETPGMPPFEFLFVTAESCLVI